MLWDVSELTDIAYYFLIATATSVTHSRTLVRELEGWLKERNINILHIEGVEGGRWILFDLLDIIIHIFLPDARNFYDLESIWGNARNVPI